jgi:uncharacterized repeat protein (TIGR03803 family)
VFKLAPTGKLTVLHRFHGPPDGFGPGPVGGLILDAKGNLYGTTADGGPAECLTSALPGCGTVFKLDQAGKVTILDGFTGYTDGANPTGSLLRDAAGNLYGTASGSDLANQVFFGGTVFKVDTSGNETTLWDFGFNGGSPGDTPVGGLVVDAAGDLYGTAEFGGDLTCASGGGFGCGIVFKLDTSGQLTALYKFTGGADGAEPRGGLVLDEEGNLYGTTVQGGNSSACSVPPYFLGCGTVFKLDPSGTETVLHRFTGGSDGGVPGDGLIQDARGSLYGTTFQGGAFPPSCGSAPYAGCGVVFKITP